MDYLEEKPGINPKISFGSLLVTAFTLLAICKLAGWMDASWWWITLPLWIVPAVFAFFFLVTLVVAILRTIKKPINPS